MKISRKNIRAVGLTRLYEPDEPSDTGLDIILVHGLGGDPVKTWLHTSTINISTASTADAKASPSSPLQPVSPNAPERSRSLMGNWASPRAKKGRTLRKENDNRHLSSPPPPRKSSPPPRPRSAEPILLERREIRRRARNEDLAGAANGQYARTSTSRPSLPPLPAKTMSHSKSARTTTAAAGAAGGRYVISRPLELDGFVPNEQNGAVEKEVYWPLDLLPESCPNARIYTFGFKTIAAAGQLVPGQLDIFARGRQLLEAVDEIRRTNGGKREVVFIAHSTGGIVVKEMLRLASTYSDTLDEGLLASIPGIVFLGSPLTSTSHGSMLIAMKSMAAATTGVAVDNAVLAELLGSAEDQHLAYLGRDAFETVWKEFNFRVKTIRETVVVPPLMAWAELGLSLRRDASILENNPEENEDIEADHVSMCRFASARDEGYLTVSSFINRFAHYQTLKNRDLTDRERTILHALADPVTPAAAPNHQKKPSASSPAPPWLLNHPHFHSWFRRKTTHRYIWLDGPIGSNQSRLLASIHNFISQHWSPKTHSSAIIGVTASEGESLLESVLLRENLDDDDDDDDEADDCNDFDTGTDRPLSFAASADETQELSIHTTSLTTPARALRSILSQLYAYDPRLRNLVRKKATTPLHAEVLETETASPILQSPTSPQDAQKVHLAHSPANKNENRTSLEGPAGADRRRWSDPTASTTDLLSAAQAHEWRLIGRGAETVQARGWAGRTQQPTTLEDADVVSLFLEDYLCFDPGKEHKRQRATGTGTGIESWDRTDDWDQAESSNIVEIPGLRRVFILVDAAGVSNEKYTRELLWCLSQLSQRSDFSICVTTATTTSSVDESTATDMARAEPGGISRSATARSGSVNVLPIMLPDNNVEEIRAYIEAHLDADVEERADIAAKMLTKSGGVALWAEMVCTIVNEASVEGVSGEIIIGMLDNIAPVGQGRLDDLYAWKMRRLDEGSAEQKHALIVMQWVMLSPEPLRLNELLVALRMTLLAAERERKGKARWEMSADKALDIEPPLSLKDLRKGADDEGGFGIATDSPGLFWQWLQTISQGLLKLESGGTSGISNEPLGLQRVRPLHESVLHFFLRGKGFQSLLPLPENPRTKFPSTDRFIDHSYYAILHACLRYLNLTELESLGREKKTVNLTPGEDLPPEETSKWRRHAEDQRKMVMASYPFLRYAVDNLVFHLLCPRTFRYFLPQRELLSLLTANRCRIWRRWTHLLGFSIADAEPAAILGRAGQGPARRLLDPVYGARYRLERVLRKVWKTAMEQHKVGGGGGSGGVGMHGRTPTTPRRTHFRSRSDVSEGSMVFTLVGSDDPLKSQWLVPTSSRSRSNSSPATPRSPVVVMPASASHKAATRVQEAP